MRATGAHMAIATAYFPARGQALTWARARTLGARVRPIDQFAQ